MSSNVFHFPKIQHRSRGGDDAPPASRRRLVRALTFGLAGAALLAGGAFGLRAWGQHDRQMFADYSLVTCADPAGQLVKIAGFYVGDSEHQTVLRPDGTVASIQGLRSCLTTLRRSAPSLADTEEDHAALGRGESFIAYQLAVDQAAAASRPRSSYAGNFSDATAEIGGEIIAGLFALAFVVWAAETIAAGFRRNH